MAYTDKQIEETFTKIIERISNGMALRKVLKMDKMPCAETFYKWIDAAKEKTERYVRACEERAEAIFEDILEIADTPKSGKVIHTTKDGKQEVREGDMIQHRKLQVDARKWMLGKLNPTKYGDKTIQKHEGHITNFNTEISKEEAKRLNDFLEEDF